MSAPAVGRPCSKCGERPRFVCSSGRIESWCRECHVEANRAWKARQRPVQQARPCPVAIVETLDVRRWREKALADLRTDARHRDDPVEFRLADRLERRWSMQRPSSSAISPAPDWSETPSAAVGRPASKWSRIGRGGRSGITEGKLAPDTPTPAQARVRARWRKDRPASSPAG